jgi:predicted amidohydrolase YtcJ
VADAVRLDGGDGLLVLEDWDETAWTDARIPRREELDRISPDRPVVLRRVDDHTAVANRAGVRALRAAWGGPGIDEESGICREDPVLLLEELVPPAPDELRAAFAAAARRCFALGITTATDFLRPLSCTVYAERFRECDPVPRIDAYVWRDCLRRPELLEALPVGGALRMRGIKAWADGSIGAREAAIFEDYADRPGSRGTLTYTDEELRAIVREGHEAGLAVAVHAIGDRAIAQVVGAFAALPPGEIRARRHRIEHLEMPRPRDVERIAGLGVRPCVQPNFVGEWGRPGGLYERALGRERARAMNPFRTLLRAGTGVFFGSDGMPPSPLYGLRCAMDHPVEEERLTLEEAHRLYTAEPAVAVGDEDPAALRPGARADLVVLPTAPDGIARHDADEVCLTVLAGRVVHDSRALEGAAARC